MLQTRQQFQFSQRLMTFLVMVLLATWSVPSYVDAQVINREDIEKPLLEGEPFDLIQMDDSNKGVLIRIIAQPQISKPLPAEGDLVFEFLRDSESLLQAPYKSIAKYESFNDLLVEEANEFLDAKKYGLAFRNLLYVYDHGGKNNRQLVETLRTCLFQDAKQRFDNKEFELALSIFEDLYQDKPNFKVPGIDRDLVDIIIACYDGILQQKFEAGEYEAIRKTVEGLKVRYGSAAVSLTKGWDKRFDAKADVLLDEAKQLAAEGQGREAHVKAKQAERISPGRQVTAQVQETLMNEFPLIIVGVSQKTDHPDPNKIDDWSARRVGRLTERNLVEITGLSDEGARYEVLNGTINRIDDVGLTYAIDIDPTMKKMGVPPLTAIQLANRLLSNANPRSETFDPTWQRILKTVELVSSTRVIITLQRPFVRPEALMQVAYPLSDKLDADGNPMPSQNGVYVLANKDANFSTFEINPLYQTDEGQQHPVIIEQRFRVDSDAVDALKRGEVDVVDRIPPADVGRLKEIENIEVRPYMVPTVHILIPKIRGDLAGNFRFRSALSTAIPREAIVVDVIGAGQKLDGCDPITGPFPLGGDDNDQISYGYDLRVKPLQFSEKLAMVLTKLAQNKPGVTEET